MSLGEAPEETESRWLVKTNKKDTRAASKFQPGSGASVKPNHGSSASQSTVTVASNEPDRVLVAAGSLDQDRRPGFSGLGKEAREEFSVVVRFESANTPFKSGAKLAVFGIQAT